MPYVTQPQLVDRFGEAMLVGLTDRGSVATGAIDSAVVTRVLTDTDALIDSYLAGRYTLPLGSIPAVLTDIAARLAIYALHVYDPPVKITHDQQTALAQLRDIRDGRNRLDVAGVEPPTQSGGGAVATDRDRPFTPENMGGFI